MDLLKSFGGLKGEEVEDDDVELSLGLSSNGRYGVDRRRGVSGDEKAALIRSASVAEFWNLRSEVDETTSLTLYPALTRTCSMPVETEVEWKRRKELQTLRRSEAKRKRVEKMKKENCEPKRRGLMCGNDLPPLPRPVPVGSPASGGSSGVSDMENQPFSGTNKETELKSTASQQLVSHQISSAIVYGSNSIPSHTTSSQNINRNPSKDTTLKMIFADMPCVSTKGDGLNGKKIEGFLYRYRKGEEVRIVCVCHGSFLTPAEFVKHGGGGDVEHPLRHIVVIPPAL